MLMPEKSRRHLRMLFGNVDINTKKKNLKEVKAIPQQMQIRKKIFKPSLQNKDLLLRSILTVFSSNPLRALNFVHFLGIPHLVLGVSHSHTSSGDYQHIFSLSLEITVPPFSNSAFPP